MIVILQTAKVTDKKLQQVTSNAKSGPYVKREILLKQSHRTQSHSPVSLRDMLDKVSCQKRQLPNVGPVN